MGLAKKPMMAVTNSTMIQIKNDILKLYPSAKVLYPDGDLEGTVDRQIFLAKAAMGDWDIVLVPHSVLNNIPNDPAREVAWIQEQIAEALEAKRLAMERGDGTERSIGVTE